MTCTETKYEARGFLFCLAAHTLAYDARMFIAGLAISRHKANYSFTGYTYYLAFVLIIYGYVNANIFPR